MKHTYEFSGPVSVEVVEDTARLVRNKARLAYDVWITLQCSRHDLVDIAEHLRMRRWAPGTPPPEKYHTLTWLDLHESRIRLIPVDGVRPGVLYHPPPPGETHGNYRPRP